MARAGDRFARISFYVALLLATGLLLWTVQPFFVPVLLGAVLVVLTQPLHAVLLRRLGGRRGLAALLATLVAFLGLVVPLVGLGLLVARELAGLVPELRELLARLEQGGGSAWLARIDRLVPGRLADVVPSPPELLQRLGTTVGAYAGAIVAATASAATSLVMQGFLMFVSTYYLYLDGQSALERMLHILPLENRYERELFHEFRDTSVAVIYGTGVVGLVQATLLFIAFTIAGVPNALVWSALALITAFIPLVGSGLVWLPVGVVMLAAGPAWKGLFILAFGALVVSTVDNILRPMLVKGRIRVHPLIVFLTMFGGLAVFGAVGFILGPLIGSLTMALWRIWERDFVDREGHLKQQQPPPPPSAPARAPTQGTPGPLRPREI